MIASVIQSSDILYPGPGNYFSPDERFPEYRYEHLSKEPNRVYRAVRDCLAQAGLDKEHYGTSQWNPLGDVLTEGDNVFVLCNFVYHKRPQETWEGFYAKCTHGSVLRAVLDYVLIAVGRSGTVRFGNASIQSCDWGRVLEETGAAHVEAFYKQCGGPAVDSCDLRSYIVKRDSFGRLTPVQTKGSDEEIEVDCTNCSSLEGLYKSNEAPRFAALDYDPKLTERYHSQNRHVYVLNRKILEADAVISLPKLKTHEKVGVTLGIKGCIGGVAHKHCLPHFRIGSPRHGGDEYEEGQWLNRLESRLAGLANLKGSGNCLRMMDVLLRRVIKRIVGRNVGGGWAGNDTTWRMSMDIARILKYSDREGVLQNEEMRRMISIVDGVIGGEGHGPLSPSARRCGLIAYNDDLAAGDYVAAVFMGLDPGQFPIIRNAFDLSDHALASVKMNEIRAVVNGKLMDQQQLAALKVPPFKMPCGWSC